MKIIKVDSCIRCPFSRLSICRNRTEMICCYSDMTIMKGFDEWDEYDNKIPEWCELSDEWDEYDEHYERKA